LPVVVEPVDEAAVFLGPPRDLLCVGKLLCMVAEMVDAKRLASQGRFGLIEWNGQY
jgi:hypothetical protein